MYVIFGDETSVSVDGELKGKTLAPVGVISVKVVRTKEKQTMTISNGKEYIVEYNDELVAECRRNMTVKALSGSFILAL